MLAIHYFVLILTGYLLGSIPFGYLLVRYVRHEDIRAVGSGNIGATNVLRSGSKGLGALTLLLDAAKGAAAVFAGAWLARSYFAGSINPRDAAAVAGLFALLGHVFPVWLRFKGGKGVATGLGVFLFLLPLASLGSFVVFAVVFALSRYVSLASILAAIALPPLGLWLYPEWHTPLFLLALFLMPAVIIVKHHQNIRRLLTGSEFRFGKPKGSAA
ncbi:MAG TPA: glycerol-3-phosphate 1-O-acyltransferase PlsY [Acidisarcina sp.]|nr:glycerol-3-phosphate 1-O-acyltransferase PlsY [Acidisarcina sp.]